MVGGGGGEVGGVPQVALEPAHAARGDKPKQPGIINLDYIFYCHLYNFTFLFLKSETSNSHHTRGETKRVGKLT